MFFCPSPYEKLGRAYQEAFAAQKPTIVPDAPLANRRLALGEFPLYVGFSFQDWRGLKGLPLRVVIPQEGALYSTLNASVVKGAPHPNAARVFLNFLLEEEAQRVITGLGSLGTTGRCITRCTSGRGKPCCAPNCGDRAIPT